MIMDPVSYTHLKVREERGVGIFAGRKGIYLAGQLSSRRERKTAAIVRGGKSARFDAGVCAF